MRIRWNSIVTLAVILAALVLVQVIVAVQAPAGQQGGPAAGAPRRWRSSARTGWCPRRRSGRRTRWPTGSSCGSCTEASQWEARP